MRLEAMGIVSSLGSGVESLNSAYESKVDPMQFLTQTKDYSEKSVFVGQVSLELPQVPEQLLKFKSRNFQLAIECCNQIESGISNIIDRYGRDRIAVIMGSSTSGIAVGESAVLHCSQYGKFPSDYQYSQQELGSVAEGIKEFLGLKNFAYTVSTACSSSAKVFASAQYILELEIADAVIVGGVDSLCQITVQGFNSLELISSNVSNPCSVNRDGINIGEGAAIFILTREGAGIQLLGVGESSDAYHISAPHPEGRGAVEAMESALKKAKISANQISYLNMHGTGTLHNDIMEVKAISQVFKVAPPMSSTKPLTGHTLGASGAIELGFCWAMLDSSMGRSKLPIHRWDGIVDPQFPELNLVCDESEYNFEAGVYCMSNSFAFGGSNCSVIIGKNLC